MASLNIAGQPRIADALASWTEARTLDLLLLQEVGHRSIDGAAFAAAIGARLGFHWIYAPANRLRRADTQGLAILSRYPLVNVRIDALERHRLRFRSRCRIALAATAISPVGPVRIVNLHLDTRINTRSRLAQLAPVVDALDGVDHPQIVGGDFNTMDIGWFRTMWPLPYAQRQSKAVRALMAERGFHTPFNNHRATFKFFGLPLRLDWLYLKGLEAAAWSVDSLPLTDHRAVLARVSPGPDTIPRQAPTVTEQPAAQ